MACSVNLNSPNGPQHVTEQNSCRRLVFAAAGQMQRRQIPAQMYIVHLALTLSPAIFGAVVYFLVQSEGAPAALPDSQSVLFQSVAAALAVLAVGFSQLLPRFLLRGEKKIPFRSYFTMKIVQWAMIEGAAMFIAVIFFLSHHNNLLIPLGVLVALLATLRPTVDEMDRHHVEMDS